ETAALLAVAVYYEDWMQPVLVLIILLFNDIIPLFMNFYNEINYVFRLDVCLFFTYQTACFYINSFHSSALHVVILVPVLIGLAKYNTIHRVLPSSGHGLAALHVFLPYVFLRRYVRTPNYSYIFSVIKWDKQIIYLLVIPSWAFYVASSGVLL